MSPVLSEEIEEIKIFQQAPRKRHRLENDELESTKRAILEKEDKKLEILTNIDSKLERLEGNLIELSRFCNIQQRINQR